MFYLQVIFHMFELKSRYILRLPFIEVPRLFTIQINAHNMKIKILVLHDIVESQNKISTFCTYTLFIIIQTNNDYALQRERSARV